MNVGQRSIDQDYRSSSQAGLNQTERSDILATPSIHGVNSGGQMRPKLGPSFYNYLPERDDREVNV